MSSYILELFESRTGTTFVHHARFQRPIQQMLARFPSYSGSRGETNYQDVGRNSALHEQSRTVKDTEDLRTSTLELDKASPQNIPPWSTETCTLYVKAFNDTDDIWYLIVLVASFRFQRGR